MTDIHQRLRELIADPKTRKAAAVIARRWNDSQDDAQLAQDLALIDAELEKAKPPAPEPIDQDRFASITARINTLLGLHKSLFSVISPAITMRDSGEFDAAEVHLEQIEQNIKSIQQGSDTPLSLRWRGEFEPGVLYEPGDVISANMSSYVATGQTKDKPSGISKVWDILSGVLGGPTGPPGAPGSPGAQGPQGPPGPGTNTVFIQESAPTDPGVNYQWWELNPDTSLRTLWVETGYPA